MEHSSGQGRSGEQGCSVHAHPVYGHEGPSRQTLQENRSSVTAFPKIHLDADCQILDIHRSIEVIQSTVTNKTAESISVAPPKTTVILDVTLVKDSMHKPVAKSFITNLSRDQNEAAAVCRDTSEAKRDRSSVEELTTPIFVTAVDEITNKSNCSDSDAAFRLGLQTTCSSEMGYECNYQTVCKLYSQPQVPESKLYEHITTPERYRESCQESSGLSCSSPSDVDLAYVDLSKERVNSHDHSYAAVIDVDGQREAVRETPDQSSCEQIMEDDPDATGEIETTDSNGQSETAMVTVVPGPPNQALGDYSTWTTNTEKNDTVNLPDVFIATSDLNVQQEVTVITHSLCLPQVPQVDESTSIKENTTNTSTLNAALTSGCSVYGEHWESPEVLSPNSDEKLWAEKEAFTALGCEDDQKCVTGIRAVTNSVAWPVSGKWQEITGFVKPVEKGEYLVHECSETAVKIQRQRTDDTSVSGVTSGHQRTETVPVPVVKPADPDPESSAFVSVRYGCPETLYTTVPSVGPGYSETKGTALSSVEPVNPGASLHSVQPSHTGTHDARWRSSLPEIQDTVCTSIGSLQPEIQDNTYPTVVSGNPGTQDIASPSMGCGNPRNPDFAQSAEKPGHPDVEDTPDVVKGHLGTGSTGLPTVIPPSHSRPESTVMRSKKPSPGDAGSGKENPAVAQSLNSVSKRGCVSSEECKCQRNKDRGVTVSHTANQANKHSRDAKVVYMDPRKKGNEDKVRPVRKCGIKKKKKYISLLQKSHHRKKNHTFQGKQLCLKSMRGTFQRGVPAGVKFHQEGMKENAEMFRTPASQDNPSTGVQTLRQDIGMTYGSGNCQKVTASGTDQQDSRLNCELKQPVGNPERSHEESAIESNVNGYQEQAAATALLPSVAGSEIIVLAAQALPSQDGCSCETLVLNPRKRPLISIVVKPTIHSQGELRSMNSGIVRGQTKSCDASSKTPGRCTKDKGTCVGHDGGDISLHKLCSGTCVVETAYDRTCDSDKCEPRVESKILSNRMLADGMLSTADNSCSQCHGTRKCHTRNVHPSSTGNGRGYLPCASNDSCLLPPDREGATTRNVADGKSHGVTKGDVKSCGLLDSSVMLLHSPQQPDSTSHMMCSDETWGDQGAERRSSSLLHVDSNRDSQQVGKVSSISMITAVHKYQLPDSTSEKTSTVQYGSCLSQQVHKTDYRELETGQSHVSLTRLMPAEAVKQKEQSEVETSILLQKDTSLSITEDNISTITWSDSTTLTARNLSTTNDFTLNESLHDMTKDGIMKGNTTSKIGAGCIITENRMSTTVLPSSPTMSKKILKESNNYERESGATEIQEAGISESNNNLCVTEENVGTYGWSDCATRAENGPLMKKTQHNMDVLKNTDLSSPEKSISTSNWSDSATLTAPEISELRDSCSTTTVTTNGCVKKQDPEVNHHDVFCQVDINQSNTVDDRSAVTWCDSATLTATPDISVLKESHDSVSHHQDVCQSHNNQDSCSSALLDSTTLAAPGISEPEDSALDFPWRHSKNIVKSIQSTSSRSTSGTLTVEENSLETTDQPGKVNMTEKDTSSQSEQLNELTSSSPMAQQTQDSVNNSVERCSHQGAFCFCDSTPKFSPIRKAKGSKLQSSSQSPSIRSSSPQKKEKDGELSPYIKYLQVFGMPKTKKQKNKDKVQAAHVNRRLMLDDGMKSSPVTPAISACSKKTTDDTVPVDSPPALPTLTHVDAKGTAQGLSSKNKEEMNATEDGKLDGKSAISDPADLEELDACLEELLNGSKRKSSVEQTDLEKVQAEIISLLTDMVNTGSPGTEENKDAEIQNSSGDSIPGMLPCFGDDLDLNITSIHNKGSDVKTTGGGPQNVRETGSQGTDDHVKGYHGGTTTMAEETTHDVKESEIRMIQPSENAMTGDRMQVIQHTESSTTELNKVTSCTSGIVIQPSRAPAEGSVGAHTHGLNLPPNRVQRVWNTNVSLVTKQVQCEEEPLKTLTNSRNLHNQKSAINLNCSHLDYFITEVENLGSDFADLSFQDKESQSIDRRAGLVRGEIPSSFDSSRDTGCRRKRCSREESAECIDEVESLGAIPQYNTVSRSSMHTGNILCSKDSLKNRPRMDELARCFTEEINQVVNSSYIPSFECSFQGPEAEVNSLRELPLYKTLDRPESKQFKSLPHTLELPSGHLRERQTCKDTHLQTPVSSSKELAGCCQRRKNFRHLLVDTLLQEAARMFARESNSPVCKLCNKIFRNEQVWELHLKFHKSTQKAIKTCHNERLHGRSLSGFSSGNKNVKFSSQLYKDKKLLAEVKVVLRKDDIVQHESRRIAKNVKYNSTLSVSRSHHSVTKSKGVFRSGSSAKVDMGSSLSSATQDYLEKHSRQGETPQNLVCARPGHHEETESYRNQSHKRETVGHKRLLSSVHCSHTGKKKQAAVTKSKKRLDFGVQKGLKWPKTSRWVDYDKPAEDENHEAIVDAFAGSRKESSACSAENVTTGPCWMLRNHKQVPNLSSKRDLIGDFDEVLGENTDAEETADDMGPKRSSQETCKDAVDGRGPREGPSRNLEPYTCRKRPREAEELMTTFSFIPSKRRRHDSRSTVAPQKSRCSLCYSPPVKGRKHSCSTSVNPHEHKIRNTCRDRSNSVDNVHGTARLVCPVPQYQPERRYSKRLKEKFPSNWSVTAPDQNEKHVFRRQALHGTQNDMNNFSGEDACNYRRPERVSQVTQNAIHNRGCTKSLKEKHSSDWTWKDARQCDSHRANSQTPHTNLQSPHTNQQPIHTSYKSPHAKRQSQHRAQNRNYHLRNIQQRRGDQKSCSKRKAGRENPQLHVPFSARSGACKFRLVPGHARSMARDSRFQLKEPHYCQNRKKLQTCYYCGRYVTRERSLMSQHLSTSHKYRCFRCKLTFDSKDSLHEHRLSVHLKERHHCMLCLKDFTSLTRYERHIRTREHQRLQMVQTSTLDMVYRACGQAGGATSAAVNMELQKAIKLQTSDIHTGSAPESTNPHPDIQIQHYYHQNPQLEGLLRHLEQGVPPVGALLQPPGGTTMNLAQLQYDQVVVSEGQDQGCNSAGVSQNIVSQTSTVASLCSVTTSQRVLPVEGENNEAPTRALMGENSMAHETHGSDQQPATSCIQEEYEALLQDIAKDVMTCDLYSDQDRRPTEPPASGADDVMISKEALSEFGIEENLNTETSNTEIDTTFDVESEEDGNENYRVPEQTCWLPQEEEHTYTPPSTVTVVRSVTSNWNSGLADFARTHGQAIEPVKVLQGDEVVDSEFEVTGRQLASLRTVKSLQQIEALDSYGDPVDSYGDPVDELSLFSMQSMQPIQWGY